MSPLVWTIFLNHMSFPSARALKLRLSDLTLRGLSSLELTTTSVFSCLPPPPRCHELYSGRCQCNQRSLSVLQGPPTTQSINAHRRHRRHRCPAPCRQRRHGACLLTISCPVWKMAGPTTRREKGQRRSLQHLVLDLTVSRLMCLLMDIRFRSI